MFMEKQLFSEWAIVELFGRTRIAGLVSEQLIAGQGFVRVDVPRVQTQSAFTRFIGPSAIYSIIPTTEEIAIAFVRRNVGSPINSWELMLPEKVAEEDEDLEDHSFDDEEEE
jgi:hypothetical protein